MTEEQREKKRRRRRAKRATEEGKKYRCERMKRRRNHPNEELRESFRNKRYRKQRDLRKWLYSLKKDMSCELCGYNEHPAGIEFHHREPEEKRESISYLLKSRKSKEVILEELKKCMPICAICHKILHFEESQHAETYMSD